MDTKKVRFCNVVESLFYYRDEFKAKLDELKLDEKTKNDILGKGQETKLVGSAVMRHAKDSINDSNAIDNVKDNTYDIYIVPNNVMEKYNLPYGDIQLPKLDRLYIPMIDKLIPKNVDYPNKNLLQDKLNRQLTNLDELEKLLASYYKK